MIFSSNSLSKYSMNYADLRTEAIGLLQRLTGHRWTDHNLHDPGITILEQLCYALTDLSYRAGFPVADLLAEGGAEAWPDTFSPRQMLHGGPLTLADWRKLLLDVPGVANVRIQPADTAATDYRPPVYYDRVEGALSLQAPAGFDQIEPLELQGLYRIDYVLEEPEDPATEDALEQETTAALSARFHAHRNLCEDLYKVRRLAEYPIAVEARVEIGKVAHPEALLAEIYDRIRTYFSPSIRFYSLQEQLAKGHTLDEVMDGPALRHGYLDEEELEAFQIRHSLRISDLIRLIMALEGVEAVRLLQLEDETGNILASTRPGQPWEWSMPQEQVASLEILHDLDSRHAPGIELWRQGRKLRVDWPEARLLISNRIEAEDPHGRPLGAAELDRLLPLGRDRKVGAYQSILHQFPTLYGIGHSGLPPNSSPHRRAQARQLRAYLSFFDQLLANEFSQLAGMRAFFDLDHPSPAYTYFSQSLQGVTPGIEELLSGSGYPSGLENPGSDDIITRQRLKRLVHHLLARFGEAFTDFADPESGALVEQEKGLLKDYAQLGYRRFQAFNYTLPAWGTDNVSGLQQRLYRLLGLGEAGLSPLAGLPEEGSQGGFHLLEHILLRPSRGDEHQQSPILLLPFNGDDDSPPREDPYSLQLSFVLPNWISRFKDEHFRQFLARTLREQTPAHLRIYLHWLDQPQMAEFEAAYQQWLQQLQIHSA